AVRRIHLDSEKLRWASVAGMMALAILLRVLDIDRVGFNSDEAVYSGQAAALAGNPELSVFFSIFRAHPLLLQTLLGGLFAVVGVVDVAARLFVSLIFGVGSVVITYFLARRLYGHWIAISAATILAVLPYHVLVSRQVLVDTPLGFFVALTIWFMAKSVDDESGRWFILAGLTAGLAAATKGPVGALLLPVMGSFLILTGGLRRLRFRTLVIASSMFIIVLLPFLLSRLLFAPSNSGFYLVWQLSRPPNHDAFYFLRVLGEFASPVFIALALLGFARMFLRRTKGDILVLMWVIIYFTFFQVWPTKLFQYLIVLVPGLSVAAAIGLNILVGWFVDFARRGRSLTPATSGMIALVPLLAFSVFLGNGSLSAIRNGPESLSGAFDLDVEVQDFAGGREVGLWAKENAPADARFMTIGPSMGNIIRFYGQRDSVALSISADPRRRNPAYRPIPNPDLWIRQLGVQYIVWDAYSADRSAFYNARLMRYVRKFGGDLVYGVYQDVDGALVSTLDPSQDADPRILVYSVHGGDPLRGNAQQVLTVPN
ncbi:MAG: glycosyltransferase family 39 protein, partial [Chloroflexi bacterium]|nr:glycosyltransferase family 39 protein [Chloroflexota bacterium]